MAYLSSRGLRGWNIRYKMQQAAPGKLLIEAPTAGKSATCKSCAHCPWMAMNDLKKLAQCLEKRHRHITIPVSHVGMLLSDEVIYQTRCFLRHGRFDPRNDQSFLWPQKGKC
jgi:hypothetical protein